MGSELTADPDAQLRAAKDCIARTLLGSSDSIDDRLGRLTLRPHQAAAVRRLLEIMRRYRGALLADAVGLGKTYVALAIARTFVNPLVVCPAALRSMWERAMVTAGVSFPACSMESLSRGAHNAADRDLVIVDEAHHFRNSSTLRYHALANLTRRARVLLLSATPLQNSRADLAAMLGLFAGPAVKGWSDPMIARLIVRRDAASAEQNLPALAGPHVLSPGSDDDCLQAILDVPPAIPAADEGVAHALATLSLVHLWLSSRAALVASVRKRRARAIAMCAALERGHVPTSAELAAWRYADGALQMVLPLDDLPSGPPADPVALRNQLEHFIGATARLIDRCTVPPDPDDERVHLLRTLRARHAGERCVAFSQYAHTVVGLARLMRADAGIALVTAAGARISSGALARDEILSQFAGDAASPRPSERIGLLLTTDLLSEGIDLRGASVIIHLDLPWNPARLEQRAGRSRRLGSPHREVHVYTFVPPAAAERMIEMRRRLTEKLRAANVLIGGSMIDPFFPPDSAAMPPVASAEAIQRLVRDWVDPASRPSSSICAGAAHGSRSGWIAAVIVDGFPRLLHDFGGGVVDDAGECLRALDEIREAVPVMAGRKDDALRSIAAWMGSRRATSGAGEQSPARRAVLERLAAVVRRSARHKRPAMLAAARLARCALGTITGAGAEQAFSALAASTDEGETWLRSLDAFVALHHDTSPRRADDVVTALILLG